MRLPPFLKFKLFLLNVKDTRQADGQRPSSARAGLAAGRITRYDAMGTFNGRNGHYGGAAIARAREARSSR